jgi:aspartyl aminopeptidase
MTQKEYNERLINFLNAAVTPYHAVAMLVDMLQEAGFETLDEREHWDLQIGKKYYAVRGGSALVAFIYTTSKEYLIAGAHTDSPVLKVKPNAKMQKASLAQLGVEVYGGALLNPWFDRDLSIAGNLFFTDKEEQMGSVLVDFKRPLALIPSLAIHLDGSANDSRSINKQTDIVPVMGKEFDLHAALLEQVPQAKRIISYDLSLYDTQKAGFIGMQEDMIVSARLDNLLSCFTAVAAIAKTKKPMMVVCNDHEEVGSLSTLGADGSFLASVIERIYPENEERTIFARSSLFVSADNAHALHPNYEAKYESQHAPKLDEGVVLKLNSNQRYASSAKTVAMIVETARKNEIPTQLFMVRNDMGCGSTIGPMTAAKLGIDTVDLGVATFAMHSIRESCGAEDPYRLYRLLSVL